MHQTKFGPTVAFKATLVEPDYMWENMGPSGPYFLTAIIVLDDQAFWQLDIRRYNAN
jgi:hypothetical protein